MAIKRGSVLAGGAALWVSAPAILRAQSSSKVNVGHGMAMHGQPKYPADATTPDYVNPAAPKGGTVRLGTQGTFDSLHPFTLKGVPAAGGSALREQVGWHALAQAMPVCSQKSRDPHAPARR